MYMLGSIYIENNPLYKAAIPVTKNVNELSGEVVTVVLLDTVGDVVVLIREERKIGFRWSTHSTYPAYASAGGKLLLSNLRDEEIDKLYPDEKLRKLTNNTISSKRELKQVLRNLKGKDLSFSREEYLEGIEAVASPIRNSSGEMVAALAIAMPVLGESKIDKLRLGDLVKLGASLISYRLGNFNGHQGVRDVDEMINLWKTVTSR
jgi:DNA-binding IclR family transcriptional regulator